uniref:DUF748 domain-containing protein n=1 Tax=Roseihalotalea indica TaxID=2867963 RepID=A0AA49GMA8_9BACT|nr:DUF748 domain-containing protein [Tunicatimonas sp. TK19036]
MKKVWITLAVIIGFFIALHFLLEPIVERLVNKQLNSLEHYSGKIDDVDIHLYRGAYRIKGIELNKRGSDIDQPFVSIDTLDLSVQWDALFDGRIVGEVILSEPVVNMVVTQNVEGDTTQEQTGTDEDWTEQIQELMPLTINRFEIRNGNITYRDPSVDPNVDAYLRNLDLVAENISNVKDSVDKLPSSLKASAVTIGDGTIDLDMKMNLLNSIPEFKADLELSSVDLTQLNDFIKAYAKFDVQEGTFTLITEITVEDKQISGYIKPFFENLDVFSLKEDLDEGSFFRKIWEALVGAGAELLENQPNDRVATEVPIEGSLDNPQPDVPATIWNVFRNAFVDAIEKEFGRQSKGGDA